MRKCPGTYTFGFDPKIIISDIIVAWLAVSLEDCNHVTVLFYFASVRLHGDRFLMERAVYAVSSVCDSEGRP